METRAQLIGESNATRAVLVDVECAAASDAKVLITGESGVGKEVVAQLIHQRSRIRLCMLQLPAVNTPQFDVGRNRMGWRMRPVGPRQSASESDI